MFEVLKIIIEIKNSSIEILNTLFDSNSESADCYSENIILIRKIINKFKMELSKLKKIFSELELKKV